MSDITELWAAEEAARLAVPPVVRLAERFVIPPFTVLNTQLGDWKARRRAWLALGIRSELGRGADLLSLSPAEGARARWANNGLVQGGKGEGLTDAWVRDKIAPRQAMERQRQPGYRYDERTPEPEDERTDEEVAAAWEKEASGGTSIFDPVLAELVYRWWAPEGGTVLDPFAGGSVRGIVAAMLGHPYTGIDLSAPQIAANIEQGATLLPATVPGPVWVHGDSAQVDTLVADDPRRPYDLVFTCPPYFDLEVYSDDPRDLSNAATYGAFLDGYGRIIDRAAQQLRDGRFMVIVVGEVREKGSGRSRGLIRHTIDAAEAAGLGLYNEAVLINSYGSAPLRVTKYMEASRKLGRVHQHVLCFLRGDPPRGWSYERPAPPDPQQALGLLSDEPPAPPGPATDAPGAPLAAVVAPEPTPSEDEPVWIDPDVAIPAAEPTLIRQDDGRWLDAETGELREGCYSCGQAPTGRYRDGSPAYDCDHPAVVAGQTSLFSDQEGTP